jgi:bifunctional non-homologous end joining protein LigD
VTNPAYVAVMSLLRERTHPGLGIIEPCLPSPAKVPPSGPGWIHEIKQDGFRIMARRDGAGVRLISRNGNDFTGRFPFIAIAVGSLPVRSCLVDGEEIVCNKNGLAVFDLICNHRTGVAAEYCAFDLLEPRWPGLTAAANRKPKEPARRVAKRLASENQSQRTFRRGRRDCLP